MRQLLAVALVGIAAVTMAVAQGGSPKVEVKGPHICCKQCVNVVAGILGKVDGVSDVKSDIKGKTVTFTAKDNKAAKAGLKALVDGGFFGTATADGKEVKVDVPAAKGAKSDTVAVKNVHVCCGQCQKAVTKIFEGSKVTFTDPAGPQRTVRIEGKGLEPAQVVDALKKGGFYGTVGN